MDYQKLAELSRRQNSAARTSLTALLQPLFRLAARQSERHDPVAENAAAIAALGLYFGTEIESIDPAGVAEEDQQAVIRRLTNIRLDNRNEFVRRFITAAARSAARGEDVMRPSIPADSDAGTMAAPMERAGYQVLLNETAALRRAGQSITLTGVDDVHYLYTDGAMWALRAEIERIRIAPAHSPELNTEAAEAGVSLYLTGHTHAGQICLPGGRPIVSNASVGRRFANGVWRHGAMTGFTSPGVGVSSLPVRYFCRGEATRLVLRRPAA